MRAQRCGVASCEAGEAFALDWRTPTGAPVSEDLAPNTRSDEAKRVKELNIVHRILAAHIKAKFVAIGRGLTEFEQEFMAHLVITDRAGNSRTMGDALLPEYRKSIDSGDNPDFKL